MGDKTYKMDLDVDHNVMNWQGRVVISFQRDERVLAAYYMTNGLHWHRYAVITDIAVYDVVDRYPPSDDIKMTEVTP